MRVYTFGDETSPAIMLLPGTCCHWKSNFWHVIPLLAKNHHVLCVSYDGFDENEDSEFTTMTDETEKIENYIKEKCGGHIHAAYGCSLGGSFVGLMAARRNIHMDYGILGGSDLDQASPLAAKMMGGLMIPMIYTLVHDGKFSSRFLEKRIEKQRRRMPEYYGAFMDMFGGARPYVTKESCRNQFVSDLVTRLPDKIDVPGTEIHIFYAKKMGAKYLSRYHQHFAHPVIHEQDLQHEELLACRPADWARLVCSIIDA